MRPGPVAHTGQGPGMSWDPARAGGVGVGCRASAPLQLQARGPGFATQMPPYGQGTLGTDFLTWKN